MRAKFINEIKQNNSVTGLGSIGIGRELIKNKIIKWLFHYDIRHYTLDNELYIFVDNDVDISDYNIIEFPEYINFKKINGDFDCSECSLISLRGCPEIVEGSFACQSNNLTSLEGGPIHVRDSYHCNYNKLISLKGSPKFVGRSFYCHENLLTTLEGGPDYVKHKYNCSQNNLISLKGIPKTVETLNCAYNRLKNFDDGPEKIMDELCVAGNKLNMTIDEIKQKYTELTVCTEDGTLFLHCQ